MRKYKVVVATNGYSRSASEAGEVAVFVEADNVMWGSGVLQLVAGDRTVAMFTQFVYWIDVTDK